MKKQKPIAVVIGNGGYNDIGQIRSCGEFGMDVIMIAPDGILMPINKSIYVKEWIKASIDNQQSLLSIIQNIASKYPNREIILYPATDLSACMIDNAYEKLSEFAIAPHANGNLRTLMDKSVMVEIAQKSNFNVPESVVLDLHEYTTSNLPIPCIIKPLRSIFGEKSAITICHDSESTQETLNRYASLGFYDVLVQALVEGNNQEEIAVSGVSNGKGIVLVHGTIHKIRIRGNGSTVFAKYDKSIDSQLTNKINTFIKETGYRGVFDIEFLLNDTGCHFIECNFRNGAYGYAITKAGFNMPGIFYLLATNKPLPDINVKNVTFMEERSDILNVLDHTITPWRWFKDIISTDTFLWWNRRDPYPMLRLPNTIKNYFR